MPSALNDWWVGFKNSRVAFSTWLRGSIYVLFTLGLTLIAIPAIFTFLQVSLIAVKRLFGRNIDDLPWAEQDSASDGAWKADTLGRPCG